MARLGKGKQRKPPSRPKGGGGRRPQDEVLEFRFRLSRDDLLAEMRGRLDIDRFSQAIAALIRKGTARPAAPAVGPGREQRAADFLKWVAGRHGAGVVEVHHRSAGGPHNKQGPKRRSLFDEVDTALLPQQERLLRQEWPPPGGAQRGLAAPPPRPPPPGRNPAPPSPVPAEGFIAAPVDRLGSYTRLRRAKGMPTVRFEDLDGGPWSDLDPDDLGDGPGQGAGDVRAFLAYIGIGLDEWEGLPVETRTSLREAIRDLLVIERAVSAVFDRLDPHFSRTALGFLKTLARRARDNKGSPKGFEKAVTKRNRWAYARDLYLVLNYLLSIVKRDFRPALIQEFDDQGRKSLAAQVNGILEERYGPRARKCTATHLEQLLTVEPREIAKDLLVEIDPKADLDAVDRSLPRHRARRRRPGQ